MTVHPGLWRQARLKTALADLVAAGAIGGEGVDALATLAGLLDRFDFWFNIIEP